MTLQQLKYVCMVAETGKITEAAKKLYISQPSLTNAIHELEKEMNVVIFNRTNKGISLSAEGEIFLGYARQVLEQAAVLEDKYKGGHGEKKKFCVSTQHYSFAVNAFVDLIKRYGQDEYDFSIRETQTYEIIEDVARMRSEIGLLFLNDFNETVLCKILKSGIVLPGQAKEKPQEAEVIAVGPGGNIDGKEVVMQVKVGDKVIYSKYAGTDVELDGEEYIIVKQNDILAIVE